MTTTQEQTLEDLVKQSLEEAEAVWNKVKDKLVVLAEARKSLENVAVKTRIPGYPIIRDGVPLVDEFITIVADMRNSTNHLLQAISAKTAKVSQLQRVYYETTALLPCLAQVIDWSGGAVTEYLGDGILALFRASPDRDRAIYAANEAATNCLQARHKVINPLLSQRYGLPEIHIGIGMAYSKAVVTLVGHDAYKQPTVFGECVWRATKLSHETDEVVVDDALKRAWPKEKGGILRFTRKQYKDLDGWLLQRVT